MSPERLFAGRYADAGAASVPIKGAASQKTSCILTPVWVRIPADRTVLAGSSYGGLAATTVAMRHPEVFGNVLSMSGSFWWSPPGTPEKDREHVAGLIAGFVAPIPYLFVQQYTVVPTMRVLLRM